MVHQLKSMSDDEKCETVYKDTGYSSDADTSDFNEARSNTSSSLITKENTRKKTTRRRLRSWNICNSLRYPSRNGPNQQLWEYWDYYLPSPSYANESTLTADLSPDHTIGGRINKLLDYALYPSTEDDGEITEGSNHLFDRIEKHTNDTGSQVIKKSTSLEKETSTDEKFISTDDKSDSLTRMTLAPCLNRASIASDVKHHKAAIAIGLTLLVFFLVSCICSRLPPGFTHIQKGYRNPPPL